MKMKIYTATWTEFVDDYKMRYGESPSNTCTEVFKTLEEAELYLSKIITDELIYEFELFDNQLYEAFPNIFKDGGDDLNINELSVNQLILNKMSYVDLVTVLEAFNEGDFIDCKREWGIECAEL